MMYTAKANLISNLAHGKLVVNQQFLGFFNSLQNIILFNSNTFNNRK